MQSGTDSSGGQPTPRHRSEQHAAYIEAVPRLTEPGSHRFVGSGSAPTDRIVFSPDHGRFPRVAAGPPSRDHGIGFRSSQEVVAEMSPVIYRPAGSGEPDRDPERPPRVSIAGPGVPTAASFAADKAAAAEPAPAAAPAAPGAPPLDDLSDLDEDPEIAEDELVDEAEDALLDDLEDGTDTDRGGDRADEGPLPRSDFDALDDPHFDDHLEAPFDEPAPPPPPPHPAPQPRRRRRLLGRHDDPVEAPVEATPPPPAFEEERQPSPVEETPTAESVAEAPATPEAPAAPQRRRRVRTLHISAPPTGPAAEPSDVEEPVDTEPDATGPDSTGSDSTASDSTGSEAEVTPGELEAPDSLPEAPAAEDVAESREPEVETAEVETVAPETAATGPDPRWRQAAPRLGAATRAPEPVAGPVDAAVGQVETPELDVEQLEEVDAVVVTEAEAEPESESESEPEADPEPELALPAGATDPTAADPDDSDALIAAQHRRTTPAISGHVTSTRGRGLSGMTVHVLDAQGEVVAQAVTGRRGGYVVDDIAPGTYHLSAGDQVDGDFADAWFGGPTADDAEPLQVEDGLTTSGVDAALPGRVVIDADVDVRRKKVVVDIAITDRTSGLPGHGSVVLSTEHFSTELPLVKGRATITLFGSTRDWDPGAIGRLGKRLRVDYVGTRHTASQSRSIRLR